MAGCAGIRREDKSKWERRVPLIPQHIKELAGKHGIEFIVQPSEIRVFTDAEYESAGAKVSEDLSPCSAVFAVKEIPVKYLQTGKTYVFFSHVIKGQTYNMPMLAKLMELGCSLIDYEKVMDDSGRRLIFFGRYAGLGGAVETICALGQRLKLEGIDTPFADIKHAHEYADLKDIEQAVKKAGEKISANGLPQELVPLVIGIAGYGNVGSGVREIIDLLPHEDIKASELGALSGSPDVRNDIIYKVVFKEEDMVEPVAPEGVFELQNYFEHPEKYRGRFESYVAHLTVMINAIYWEERYPRLVTKKGLKELFGSENKPRLRVIGDISCDIEGSVEVTVEKTGPGNPCYVYNPADGSTSEDCEGDGVVIMAVDNLPCEIPAESSIYFSGILKDFIAPIVEADYSMSYEELALPPEIKRALILHNGALTPDYRYLEEHVNKTK
jgi:alpha-aminoadipic semialdehyde synthase